MARTDTLPHFLTDVADAIRTKAGTSGSIQASTFDTAIANIPSGGGSGWQRPSDWWDIKTILDNAETRLDDNGNTLYPVFAILVDDWNAISGFAATKAEGLLTSDGAWYGHGGIIHTWDPTYDKPCSEGYKTRYVIVYRKSKTYSANELIDLTSFRGLEIYFGDFQITSTYGVAIGSISTGNANRWFRNIEFSDKAQISSTVTYSGNNWYLCYNCSALEHVNFNNTIPNDRARMFNNCYNLKQVEGNNFTIDTTSFNNCYSLREVDIGTATTLSNYFNYAYSLEKLVCPNITSISTAGIFIYNYSLRKLTIPSTCTTFPTKTSGNPLFGSYIQFLELYDNFAINNVNLTDDTRLTHSCLVDIMNKLKDVTGESGTYTLTLGSSHIGRLSADELAIGTNKGWVIN